MRVPICGKSNVGTAGADWLLVIYFIACFNTDNFKISGFRERKKKKSEKSICHARQKGYLEIHLNYFFINAQRKFSIFDEIIVKIFHPFSPAMCSVERSGGIFYSILNC